MMKANLLRSSLAGARPPSAFPPAWRRLLPGVACSIVATTYPGTWEDAYRAVVRASP